MMTHKMNALPQADNINVADHGRPRTILKNWSLRQSHAGRPIMFQMLPTGNDRGDKCP